eukprot:12223874-Prorocentrum_lima.AAC.1
MSEPCFGSLYSSSSSDDTNTIGGDFTEVELEESLEDSAPSSGTSLSSRFRGSVLAPVGAACLSCP